MCVAGDPVACSLDDETLEELPEWPPSCTHDRVVREQWSVSKIFNLKQNAVKISVDLKRFLRN